jgi:hypothetical protein
MGILSLHKTKLRRDNTFQKCSQVPRIRPEGGAKVESFKDLEDFLSWKRSEAQEEEQKWSLDRNAGDQQSSDQNKVSDI